MAAASVRGLTSNLVHTLAPTAFDSGGGGGVHAVEGQPQLVAKLFNCPERISEPLGRRLRAVVQMGINDPHIARVEDVLVSPTDTDEVVGVLMERINGHTLYSITNPDERKLLGIKITSADRIQLAAKLAGAFEAMHSKAMRLGDAHHRNVMGTFDRRGQLTGVVVIEPDTWIFEWRADDGRMEKFTSIARPDFLPPEFQGVDLRHTRLTFESDRFALVLLVCLALFDCTPQAFAGSALTAEERIRAGFDWITGTLPPGTKPPDRLPIEPAAVPDEVMALLRLGLSKSPNARPSAAQLAVVLGKWHQDAQARLAPRLVSAIWGLVRARSLAEFWRRAVDAFFATRRRVGSPASAARGWGAVIPGLLIALIISSVALWSGGAPPPVPAPAEQPKHAVTGPPLPAVPKAHSSDRAKWRSLLEP
jgi:DNA-binding helix-hairpin-helix protein with protein kinase domain